MRRFSTIRQCQQGIADLTFVRAARKRTYTADIGHGNDSSSYHLLDGR